MSISNKAKKYKDLKKYAYVTGFTAGGKRFYNFHQEKDGVVVEVLTLKQIEDKLKMDKEDNEIERLKEYQEAYYYLLEYWDCFDEDGRKQINKDLNEIFKLNKNERYEEYMDFDYNEVEENEEENEEV